MAIKEKKDWNEFLAHINKMYDTDGEEWGFRGVKDETKPLIPSVGRKPEWWDNKYGTKSDKEWKKHVKEWEEEIFIRFKRRALPYISSLPTSDFAWLAVARHHGLPTRLLDWTYSPLVAAYFAIDKSKSEYAAIYAYKFGDYLDDEDINTSKEVFAKTYKARGETRSKAKTVESIEIGHYTARVTSQRSFFTIHGNPIVPFNPKGLKKYRIHKNMYSYIQDKLDLYGINAATLFPDLTGLGEYLASWYEYDDEE